MISFKVVSGVVHYQISMEDGTVITPWEALKTAETALDTTPCEQLSYFLRREGFNGRYI